ncbi:MAG: TIGR00266 family protein [Neisseria sp.]|nr:TIGR00266 family protein [Neisseria sp.]
MPVFTVTGDDSPFLHVSLQRGESISCESGAMVMMEANLDLTARMQGGLLGALTRRLANGESFFQQHIKAVRGGGDCLLSPTLPGAIQVLDVGAVQYKIADGAYLAATEHVEIKAQLQNIGTALFGNSGGFLIGQTSGDGQVVVGGHGSLFTLEVTPETPMTIDNGHVVAWDSRLNHNISLSTNQGGSQLGNIINSVTGGEGVVLKFSGSGKIVICSRNKAGAAKAA